MVRSLYLLNLNSVISFSSCATKFVSDLVENHEDQFSNVVAYITMTGKVKDNSNLSDIVYRSVLTLDGSKVRQVHDVARER